MEPTTPPLVAALLAVSGLAVKLWLSIRKTKQDEAERGRLQAVEDRRRESDQKQTDFMTAHYQKIISDIQGHLEGVQVKLDDIFQKHLTCCQESAMKDARIQILEEELRAKDAALYPKEVSGG